MTIYLDRDAVVTVGSIACEEPLVVRDEGLLQSAVARPKASAFGLDAYPDEWGKAAALLQSLTANHPFVDGNKRTAWQSAYVFLGLNDIHPEVALDNDGAEDFMNAVATGDLVDWRDIGRTLHSLYTT
ncbi:type II toxin-antitoxin system death-on-curing family toxin [Gordonia sp. NPDC003425]